LGHSHKCKRKFSAPNDIYTYNIGPFSPSIEKLSAVGIAETWKTFLPEGFFLNKNYTLRL